VEETAVQKEKKAAEMMVQQKKNESLQVKKEIESLKNEIQILNDMFVAMHLDKEKFEEIIAKVKAGELMG